MRAITSSASKLLTFLLWTAVAVWVVIVVMMAGLRISGGNPMVVLTDSMEPAFRSGDMVVLRQTKAVNPGQVRAFVAPVRGNPTVIHRVIAPGQQAGTWLTKGDANSIADPWQISAGQFAGQVDLVVPRVGNLLMFISSTNGRVALIAIPVALLLLMLLLDAVAGRRERKAVGQDDVRPGRRRGRRWWIAGGSVAAVGAVVVGGTTVAADSASAAFTTRAVITANSIASKAQLPTPHDATVSRDPSSAPSATPTARPSPSDSSKPDPTRSGESTPAPSPSRESTKSPPPTPAQPSVSAPTADERSASASPSASAPTVEQPQVGHTMPSPSYDPASALSSIN